MTDGALGSRKLERTSEPGIYHRGGRYVVVYRDALGRQHKRSGGTTLKQARDTKARLRADVSRGEDTEVSREPFAVYARRWIDHYAGRTEKGIRQETRDSYRRLLEQNAIPFLGKVPVSQVRQVHLNDLAAQIAARGAGPTTVRAALAPVKALFASALAAGDIRVNPTTGWRSRYAQTATDDAEPEQAKELKEDQLQALLAEIPDEWQLFYAFLAQTGLRIGEAIEIRWRDVDFGRKTVSVSRRFYLGRVAAPKSKYGRRTVGLAPSLTQRLWTRQGGAEELVFTSATGERIDQSNLMSRVLKPAAVRAGLGEWVKDFREKPRAESWVGHHTFRHTCASILFRHGFNAKQVQVWLGHHSPEFTLKTYVHLLPEDLPEVPAAVDLLVGGGNNGATKLAETDRNAQVVEGPFLAQPSATAKLAEVAAVSS